MDEHRGRGGYLPPPTTKDSASYTPPEKRPIDTAARDSGTALEAENMTHLINMMKDLPDYTQIKLKKKQKVS